MTDLLPVDVSNIGLAGCAIAIALGGFLRGFFKVFDRPLKGLLKALKRRGL